MFTQISWKHKKAPYRQQDLVNVGHVFSRQGLAHGDYTETWSHEQTDSESCVPFINRIMHENHVSEFKG
jgi:hypothetical protein